MGVLILQYVINLENCCLQDDKLRMKNIKTFIKVISLRVNVAN